LAKRSRDPGQAEDNRQQPSAATRPGHTSDPVKTQIHPAADSVAIFPNG